eukprot:scaffold3882_cov164-Amphora_coffeaeformis.AAC.16
MQSSRFPLSFRQGSHRRTIAESIKRIFPNIFRLKSFDSFSVGFRLVTTPFSNKRLYVASKGSRFLSSLKSDRKLLRKASSFGGAAAAAAAAIAVVSAGAAASAAEVGGVLEDIIRYGGTVQANKMKENYIVDDGGMKRDDE